MVSQYKNLFFDLDDTLWAFSLNARDTFEEMYHKYDYDRFFRSFQHFYTLSFYVWLMKLFNRLFLLLQSQFHRAVRSP